MNQSTHSMQRATSGLCGRNWNDRDSEHRKAVETIVALVGDQDEATHHTLGEPLRVALKLRRQAEAVSP